MPPKLHRASAGMSGRLRPTQSRVVQAGRTEDRDDASVRVYLGERRFNVRKSPQRLEANRAGMADDDQPANRARNPPLGIR